MRKIFNAIGNSTLEKTNGNKRRIYSSSIISSFFILITIWLSAFVFIAIDISNAIIMKQSKLTYEIPMTHIFIYSLTLTHHLVLLGLKRGSDAKYLESTVKMKEIDANSQVQAQYSYGYDDNYYQQPCMMSPCARMNQNNFRQPKYHNQGYNNQNLNNSNRNYDEDDEIDDNLSRAPRNV